MLAAKRYRRVYRWSSVGAPRRPPAIAYRTVLGSK